MSLNQFQFIGNLTREPVVHQGDKPRATIDIAVNDVWKDAEGKKQEHTNYFRLTAFGKLAEVVGKNLEKGAQIFVQGRIEATSYEKDGHTVYGHNFVADTIQFL
jgi:single-strand DNA-binding protein